MKLPLLLTALLATVTLGLAADAKPKPGTYLTEEQARAAGPDFDWQGEYVTAKNPPDALFSTKPYGAQVIALGEGKFRLVYYEGGLPGAGWNGKPRKEIDGSIVNEIPHFYSGSYVLFIRGGGIQGKTAEGEMVLWEKTKRQSPTLGTQPPAGAVVLFDGSNCDAFASGHFDELGRKLLASGSKTKRADFQNYTLHVEFILPFKPLGRGQDRANSGVYMQDRYEVQVLDSFGLAGKNNECGGIYSKTEPRVNMCFPPLVWQSYDIDFTAAKFDGEGKKTQNAVITVKHNNVIIHDKVEIAGPTGGGKKEDATGGAIQLQGHGNPVFYRNVWIAPR